MFGPLVVHQARTADPNSDLYGHDLPEHLIMVSYFALYSLAIYIGLTTLVNLEICLFHSSK